MEQKGGAAMRRWTEIGKDLLIVILVFALLVLTLLALPERTLTRGRGAARVLKGADGGLPASKPLCPAVFVSLFILRQRGDTNYYA